MAINNDKLGSSGTALLSLIWTPLQPPMKKAPSCLILCTWAVNTWRYVLYEWGAMEAVTLLLFLLAVSCQLSISHFGKLAASSIWKPKIGKGICRAVIWCVLGFKKDHKLKAVESKKAYQYHHGYVTLNKPLVMIHSWLLAKWNRIFLLFIVLPCKTCTTTGRKKSPERYCHFSDHPWPY